MSWLSMANELSGQTPVPLPLALTFVNRAWLDIQREFEWSFLYDTATIPTASPLSAGTVTVVFGSPTVVADPTALAAWNSTGLVNPLTTRQFRTANGNFYNITAFDPTAGTITLEKPFVDIPMGGTGTSYTIVGAYFNAPTPDFIWWESIRDPISGNPISTTLTRESVDQGDPLRYQSGWPRGVIPYRVNPTPGAFSRYPQYEFWPAPSTGYTYIGSYFRRGLPFTSPNDAVLSPLNEDVVIAAAKAHAYEWCAANPDKCPKADYRFLMGAAQAERKTLLNSYILTDESFSHRHTIGGDNLHYSLPWVSQGAGLMRV